MNTEIETAHDEWLSEVLDNIGVGDDERGPFLAFVNNNYHRPIADDYREAYSSFQDAYEGEWDSLGEFASNMAEQCYDIDDLPSWITNHIDWEDVWSCELRHDYFAVSVDDDGLAPFWVFRNV